MLTLIFLKTGKEREVPDSITTLANILEELNSFLSFFAGLFCFVFLV